MARHVVTIDKVQNILDVFAEGKTVFKLNTVGLRGARHRRISAIDFGYSPLAGILVRLETQSNNSWFAYLKWNGQKWISDAGSVLVHCTGEDAKSFKELTDMMSLHKGPNVKPRMTAKVPPLHTVSDMLGLKKHAVINSDSVSEDILCDVVQVAKPKPHVLTGVNVMAPQSRIGMNGWYPK